MPFKTSDQVWVESCDRPPSNTRSSVHFHVPKTGRHLAWLSGGTDCYSPGMLPIPPPVPKNFPLDVSSARVVRRRSSNLLRGQKRCTWGREDSFGKMSFCGLPKILRFNLVNLCFLFFCFSYFHIHLLEASAWLPKHYHLRSKVLTCTDYYSNRAVNLIPLRRKFERNFRPLTREFIVFKILFCDGITISLS